MLRCSVTEADRKPDRPLGSGGGALYDAERHMNAIVFTGWSAAQPAEEKPGGGAADLAAFHADGGKRRFVRRAQLEIAKAAHRQLLGYRDTTHAGLGDSAERQQVGAAEQPGAAGQRGGQRAHRLPAGGDRAGG